MKEMNITTYDTPLLTALEQLRPQDHLCSIYESVEENLAVADIEFDEDTRQQLTAVA